MFQAGMFFQIKKKYLSQEQEIKRAKLLYLFVKYLKILPVGQIVLLQIFASFEIYKYINIPFWGNYSLNTVTLNAKQDSDSSEEFKQIIKCV